MTRNRNIADVQSNGVSPVAPFTAGKNAIINGAFDIWQRGTSIGIAASTGVSTGTYGPDRWQSSGTNANQAITISRQATNDATNLPNIQYCVRYQRNSGQTGAGYTAITQSIETTNSIPFAGKTVNFSFYARAGANYSTSANALYMQLKNGTGTDQNVNSPFTGDNAPINGQVTLTTTWQRFSFSVGIPTNATELGVTFVANFTGTAGAADYFEVTGVQVELGSVATPFSRAGGSLGAELALCQRYFQRIGNNGGAYYMYTSAAVEGSTTLWGTVPLPVTMRTTPSMSATASGNTFTILGYGNVGAGTIYLDTAQSGPQSIVMGSNAISGLTLRQSCYIRNLNDTTGTYISLSAEL